MTAASGIGGRGFRRGVGRIAEGTVSLFATSSPSPLMVRGVGGRMEVGGLGRLRQVELDGFSHERG